MRPLSGDRNDNDYFERHNDNLFRNLSGYDARRGFLLYTETVIERRRSGHGAPRRKIMKDVIVAVLTLLSGIGIFLVACSMMSGNLESVGSNRLRSLFSKASGSNLLGVGIGAVGTAAIQSSGATTVMVIGFVNAGIMSLKQAAS